jgi:FkbM family methyltransferase
MAPQRSRLPEEFRDIEQRLPGYRPSVIFDVGANVGQSCVAYANAYPKARIYSFEPVPQTYARLCENISPYPNITAYDLALGGRAGVAVMTAIGTGTANRIRPDEEPGASGTATVRVDEGHRVAAEIGVTDISYLKIDTEGFDLEVLHGFKPLFPRIDFVQVEASMNPYNTAHVGFRVLEDFLREQGFLLFKFYAQAFEFGFGGLPVLRRTNPLFIRGAIVKAKSA